MERFRAALVCFLAAALTSCTGQGSRGAGLANPGIPNGAQHSPSHRPLDTLGGGPANFSINIMLGDAAPMLGGKTLAHLYIGVDRVDVTSGGATATVASYGSPAVVDVLQYQGNSGASVADSATNRTSYSSVTFVLDIASSQAVFTDGSSAPISFMENAPNESWSGADSNMSTVADGIGAVDVTSNLPFTIPANAAQGVRADFNAFESLALRNGAIAANPVMFVAPQADSGELTGTVVNRSGSPVKNAVVVAYDPSGHPRNVAVTGADGSFDLTTLARRRYQLVIFNEYVNAAGRSYYATGTNNGNTAIYGPSVTLQGSSTSAGAISD